MEVGKWKWRQGVRERLTDFLGGRGSDLGNIPVAFAVEAWYGGRNPRFSFTSLQSNL